MSWAYAESVPYVSESNGVIERQNGVVYDGLRTCLARAGFGPELCPLAGEYCCDVINIGHKDPSEAYGLDRDCP